jgi:hypothetical protein
VLFGISTFFIHYCDKVGGIAELYFGRQVRGYRDRFYGFFSVSPVRGYDNISYYSAAVSFHSFFNSLCINHFVI